MKIIDLSQTVSESSLIYPGDPGIELEQVESIERGDNVNSEIIRAGVHVLTHVDAPGHQVKNGKTLDQYPLSKFVQKALLITCRKTAISKKDLEPFRRQISQTGALIIRTGFDEILKKGRRGKDDLKVRDLPKITPPCANWLAKFKNLELFGIDSLTVGNQKTHAALLKKDILLVEGLDLAKAPKNFLFFCLPWKLAKTNGAPCRAIALIL